MKTMLGTLRASGMSGRIGIDPSVNVIEDGVQRGEITSVRILAEPSEPVAVCRFLLKMGLEVLANELGEVLSSRYDAARAFARRPLPGEKWWFLVTCDFDKLFLKFKNGVTETEWRNGVALTVGEFDGAAIFQLRLLDMNFFVPLEQRVLAAPDLYVKAPNWQVYDVTA